MRQAPSAPPSSRSVSSGSSRAARDCWPSACSVATRRLRRACAEGTAGAHTGRTLRASSGSGSARSFPGGRVAVAAGLPERAALDALLQGAAEAQRAPVLAAEPVADLVLRQLPLLAEEVLDQRDLAPEPPLVLVLVVLRDPRKWGVGRARSEEHTSELQSRQYLVCRLLLEKKKKKKNKQLPEKKKKKKKQQN